MRSGCGCQGDVDAKGMWMQRGCRCEGDVNAKRIPMGCGGLGQSKKAGQAAATGRARWRAASTPLSVVASAEWRGGMLVILLVSETRDQRAKSSEREEKGGKGGLDRWNGAGRHTHREREREREMERRVHETEEDASQTRIELKPSRHSTRSHPDSTPLFRIGHPPDADRPCRTAGLTAASPGDVARDVNWQACRRTTSHHPPRYTAPRFRIRSHAWRKILKRDRPNPSRARTTNRLDPVQTCPPTSLTTPPPPRRRPQAPPPRP